MGKLINEASLPLEGIEVMQDELMFVHGGVTGTGFLGSGCNCKCDTTSGSGILGDGCNCECSTTTAAN